nr:4434_t:CDS:2 [Entrophospora candida]
MRPKPSPTVPAIATTGFEHCGAGVNFTEFKVEYFKKTITVRVNGTNPLNIQNWEVNLFVYFDPRHQVKLNFTNCAQGEIPNPLNTNGFGCFINVTNKPDFGFVGWQTNLFDDDGIPDIAFEIPGMGSYAVLTLLPPPEDINNVNYVDIGCLSVPIGNPNTAYSHEVVFASTTIVGLGILFACGNYLVSSSFHLDGNSHNQTQYDHQGHHNHNQTQYDHQDHLNHNQLQYDHQGHLNHNQIQYDHQGHFNHNQLQYDHQGHLNHNQTQHDHQGHLNHNQLQYDHQGHHNHNQTQYDHQGHHNHNQTQYNHQDHHNHNQTQYDHQDHYNHNHNHDHNCEHWPDRHHDNVGFVKVDFLSNAANKLRETTICAYMNICDVAASTGYIGFDDSNTCIKNRVTNTNSDTPAPQYLFFANTTNDEKVTFNNPNGFSTYASIFKVPDMNLFFVVFISFLIALATALVSILLIVLISFALKKYWKKWPKVEYFAQKSYLFVYGGLFRVNSKFYQNIESFYQESVAKYGPNEATKYHPHISMTGFFTLKSFIPSSIEIQEIIRPNNFSKSLIISLNANKILHNLINELSNKDNLLVSKIENLAKKLIDFHDIVKEKEHWNIILYKRVLHAKNLDEKHLFREIKKWEI